MCLCFSSAYVSQVLMFHKCLINKLGDQYWHTSVLTKHNIDTFADSQRPKTKP